MKIKNTAVIPSLIKAGEADGLEDGQFIVYPSTFTKTPDSYGDIVAPGAFEEDLAAWKESGLVMPGLYGHRMDDPDYSVAYALDMGEDDHGWWVKGQFDMDSPKAPSTYRLAKGKRLNQLSFAYDVVDEGQVELEDGTKANELRKLKTYEFSFVPVGANQDTSIVAMKAIAEAIKAGGVALDGAKAGRVLSGKNEKAIRDAVAALQDVLKSLGNSDDEDQDPDSTESEEDQDKASGSGPAKDEARQRKSEEPGPDPSVAALIAEIEIAALA